MEWLERRYWHRLNTGCTITDAPKVTAPIDLRPNTLETLARRLTTDGFSFVSRQRDLPTDAHEVYDEAVLRLSFAVKRLIQHGWPPTFVCLLDESWVLARLLSRVISCVTGGNELMYDLVSWHIESGSEAGFTPHRDRHLGVKEACGPDLIKRGFRDADNFDGPKYTTCWIALTDANPDNGCLYVIPRDADPGYDNGDCSVEAAMGSASIHDSKFALRLGPDKKPNWVPNSEQAYQHIRACPCSRGDVVVLSHRVIHWGSRGRPGAGARISFSFASSDHAFEPPYLETGGDPNFIPKFDVRLALACGQMICYAGNARFELSAAELKRYRRTFRTQKEAFTKAYKRKVRAAWKAIRQRDVAPGVTSTAAEEDERDARRRKRKRGANGRGDDGERRQVGDSRRRA